MEKIWMILILAALMAPAAGPAVAEQPSPKSGPQQASQEPDLNAPTHYAVTGQPSYQALKSPLKTRVVDRRFYTREAMYLANEMNQSGDPFLRQAQFLGLPVEKDTDFQYMTATESYWYSRYNMQVLITESRLGLVLIHGPYITEKAVEIANAQYNRDRGENELSNKDVLFEHIIPAYLSRTGFPRRFEDASPLMIEFASGDPHFIRPVDKGTQFELSENRWRQRKFRALYGDGYEPPPTGAGIGGNDMWKYRVNYRENFASLRWSNDKMDHAIDLGGAGQSLMKAVLWMEYFFRQTHHDQYLGNNPEEGFRGAILNLSSVSKMLLLKSSLFYDGQRLHGLNPFAYDPAKKLSYFPHEIAVKARYIGDLPPRPEEFKVRDPRSLLYDQASLLWGLSEYFYLADPGRDRSDPAYREAFNNWDKVFGDNPPYDGSLMERKYMHLARGLGNVIVRNLDAMHRDPETGVLVSEWAPRKGRGRVANVADLGMTILGLANYRHHLAKAEPELAARAGALLRAQTDFLVERLQNANGTFPEGYDLAAQRKLGDQPTLLAQGLAIRGLLRAYQELGEARYLEAAKKAYGAMNRDLWDSNNGIYRSHAQAAVSVYTPLNLAAALGAMREMILVTRNADEIERYKRFWVQAVNSSGIQQSEYEETGEGDLTKQDGDGDGIPRMEFAGGKYGIAPVFAGRVEIETPVFSSPLAQQTKRVKTFEGSVQK
ncbi:MAG: hypothetical protein HYR55_13110 [Acidobacteria bacterium]|nr:hypothetical protein [Acidobacteriota bacterium]